MTRPSPAEASLPDWAARIRTCLESCGEFAALWPRIILEIKRITSLEWNMNDSLMKQVEEATIIAFSEYRVKQPELARIIEHDDLLDAVIQSINSDPKALAGLDEASASQSRMNTINQLAQLVREKLPSVLSMFEA
jgi:hypothetical protein